MDNLLLQKWRMWILPYLILCGPSINDSWLSRKSQALGLNTISELLVALVGTRTSSILCKTCKIAIMSTEHFKQFSTNLSYGKTFSIFLNSDNIRLTGKQLGIIDVVSASEFVRTNRNPDWQASG